jgi:hypothetical protein
MFVCRPEIKQIIAFIKDFVSDKPKVMDGTSRFCR